MQPEMLKQRHALGPAHRGAGHWEQGFPGSPRTRAEPGSQIPAPLRAAGSCSVSAGVDFSHWLSYSLQLKRKDWSHWSQQPMRERSVSLSERNSLGGKGQSPGLALTHIKTTFLRVISLVKNRLKLTCQNY